MKNRIFTALFLLLGTSMMPVVAQAAEAMEVTMILVTPDSGDYSSHRNGAILGQTEGNIQGQFLGINYELIELSLEEALAYEGLPSAVVVAGPSDYFGQITGQFGIDEVPIFNISNSDNALREVCLNSVYHTLPSDRMLADAVSQWQQANPGAEVEARAWHPAFVKFAARDLNKRYMEQFGVEMDSDAWAGWAATRIMAEAVVRTSSSDPADIIVYLNDSLVFDGQKGATHNFRPNGQLRQPLLLVDSEGELLGEAPVRGIADSNDLDSLGLADCN